MFTASSLFSHTKLVRECSPLIHYITNQVAANFTANVLLAIGASPAMVIAPEQVEEFVNVANSLSVNFGTLDQQQKNAIGLAVDAANKRSLPSV